MHILGRLSATLTHFCWLCYDHQQHGRIQNLNGTMSKGLIDCSASCTLLWLYGNIESCRVSLRNFVTDSTHKSAKSRFVMYIRRQLLFGSSCEVLTIELSGNGWSCGC